MRLAGDVAESMELAGSTCSVMVTEGCGLDEIQYN